MRKDGIRVSDLIVDGGPDKMRGGPQYAKT